MQDIAAIFRHNENISFTRCHDGDVFFLLQKPEENNAQVLMRLTRDGQLQRLTAPGTSVRSRLHEYGAMPYAIGQSAVYFCKHDSQQIACQRFNANGPDGAAVTLTPDLGQALLRYGDFVVDSQHNQLIAVREDHRDKEPGEHGEPRNCLVTIDLDSGGEGRILFDQSDFVINPRLSPDGHLLAFVSWDHPYMPWDQTRLWVATLDVQGQLASLREIIAPRPAAIQQVQFSADGDLYFLADWTDWWNLYRLDGHHLQQSRAATIPAPSTPLCERPHDGAGPPWVPGLQHYAVINQNTVAVALLRGAHWYVEKVDIASGRSHPLWSELGAIDALCAQGEDLVIGFSPTDRPPAIERCTVVDPAADAAAQPDTLPPQQAQLLLQCRSDAWQPNSVVQRPQHLTYPCTVQLAAADIDARAAQRSPLQVAHGLLYLPPDTTTPPPLLVMVHGGPTGTARSAFNPFTQFWVQQGFAVFDINHRGSSGYGRQYRQLLLGQWGVIDIEDIIAGVQHLIASRQVDPSRVVIRGGSAGGYAVLAALAQSDVFLAGTCCYGVSDLISLAAETHKFESRYVERLIGPLPQAEAVYRARSPIHQLDRIHAPVLWLHGALDKVVPPNQATDIMAILQPRSPDSRYVCFDDEGHGFRLPANQISALNEELLFYQIVGALSKTETY